MGIFDDIRKTVNYAKRNGVSAAFDAAVERLTLNRTQYAYAEPDRETLKRQQGEYSRAVFEAGKNPSRPLPVTFSVLTPLYMTDKEQLAQMIESVKHQSWGGWELILTDASPVRQRLGATVDQVARDGRIFYYELPRNDGIAENTNMALKRANGDYIVLLDHDDLLAPDALYELAKAIVSCGFEQSKGAVAKTASMQATQIQTASSQSALGLSYRCMLAYSDEDKFADEPGRDRRFFEPHHKPDFDFDRLLTNNYICHLTAIRADIAKRLQFRGAYDGAQDYDLFLRTCAEAVFRQGTNDGDRSNGFSANETAPSHLGTSKQGTSYRTSQELSTYVAHVPKVLYHWRSHALSTASNPASKTYAYDAGQKALEDFAGTYFSGSVKVEPMKHLGFYYIRYEEDVFRTRPDIGIVGGKVTDERGTLIGGRMDEEGNVFYEGLKRGQSGGYQHAAVLEQEADAVDLRNMTINPALEPLFRAVLANANDNIRDIITLVNGKVIIGEFLTPEEAKEIRDAREKTAGAGVGQTEGLSETAGGSLQVGVDLKEKSERFDNGVRSTAGRNNQAQSKTGRGKAPHTGGHIDISVGEGEDVMSLLNPIGKKVGVAGKDDVSEKKVGAGTANESQVSTPSTPERANITQENRIPLVELDPAELKNLSLVFCKAVREKGYRIVWDPQK